MAGVPALNWQAPERKEVKTNQVDPACSHMLVSKIKPCMSQYELPDGETVNGSLKQLHLT